LCSESSNTVIFKVFLLKAGRRNNFAGPSDYTKQAEIKSFNSPAAMRFCVAEIYSATLYYILYNSQYITPKNDDTAYRCTGRSTRFFVTRQKTSNPPHGGCNAFFYPSDSLTCYVMLSEQ
jgi:hypothetical protein